MLWTPLIKILRPTQNQHGNSCWSFQQENILKNHIGYGNQLWKVASPAYQLAWKHDVCMMQEISEAEGRVRVETRKNLSCFIIEGADRSDEGLYHITVTNPAGEDKADVMVKIVGEFMHLNHLRPSLSVLNSCFVKSLHYNSSPLYFFCDVFRCTWSPWECEMHWSGWGQCFYPVGSTQIWWWSSCER